MTGRGWLIKNASLAIALSAAAGAVLLAQAAPFKDGDRVVFFGDSITHGVEAGARIEMGAPFTDGAILADHVRPKAHCFEIAAVARPR